MVLSKMLYHDTYETVVLTKKKKFAYKLEKLTQYAITRGNSGSKCYDD